MLTSLIWIQKGKLKEQPEFYGDPEDEMIELQDDTQENKIEDDTNNQDDEMEEATDMEEDEKEPTQNTTLTKEEAFNNLHMENYDDEEVIAPIFSGKQIMQFEDNHEDPYITIPDEEDNEEEEDFRIKPTDSVLVTAVTEEDFSRWDLFVYEEKEDNCYIHHDTTLTSYPLCLEYISVVPGSEENEKKIGNFVAIGTFEPGIEIWDLDLVDAVQPLKPGSHKGAVMDLVANSQLGDLCKLTCLQTYDKIHTDKIQSLSWHPNEPSVLLSGSFDKTACVFDVKNLDTIRKWDIFSDCESLEWNYHDTQQFLVATEDGFVRCYNLTIPDKPVWTLKAHNKSTTSISFNKIIPGYFATSSTDKTIHLWKIEENKPSLLHTIKANDHVYCVSFCPDSPLLLASGGRGVDSPLTVWNTGEFKEINSFIQELQKKQS